MTADVALAIAKRAHGSNVRESVVRAIVEQHHRAIRSAAEQGHTRLLLSSVPGIRTNVTTEETQAAVAHLMGEGYTLDASKHLLIWE